MLKNLSNLYLDSFKGLSREVWFLALVTFINRAGTMILPFLSKYLKEDLGFSYQEVGWIMVFFGVGAFVGAWLGGRFTDKIGYYKVMVISLFFAGVLFIVLQFLRSFWAISIGMFVIMAVADMFRPAIYVSLNAYSKPENRTRSLTLIRLAINLGFVLGPTLAGILIMSNGYSMLFWIDGLTCIFAVLVFTYLVKERQGTPMKKKDEASLLDTNASVFKDKVYWVFLIISFLIGAIFFQLFSILPIYHNEKYGLTEFQTGLLFFLNGALIVVFEMPMVAWIQKKKIPEISLIIACCLLMSISFALLIFDSWVGILTISMVFITVAEMVGFPYTNAFAMKRAKSGNEGRYMALYAMAFALGQIVGPKFGLDIVGFFGYKMNFIFMAAAGLLAALLALVLKNMLTKEGLTVVAIDKL